MDTDDLDVNNQKMKVGDNESEEGELSDEELSANVVPKPSEPKTRSGIADSEHVAERHKLENRTAGYITGVDVFGKEEQARLVEKAKHIGSGNSEANLSEKELKMLYRSVGVTEGDDKKFRFDSIRMHGTEAMSTQDVFEYFKDYAPISIEWIDDETCNVVWLDNLSAIRALLGLSKPIKNLEKVSKAELCEGKEAKNEENESDCDSDVVMLENDGNGTIKTEELEDELAQDPEAIDAQELNLNMPPGIWRKGNTHPNSDGILLRFCPRESGSISNDGPKRLPQPVFGVVGLLSKSRKQRIKDGLIVRPKVFPDDMGDDRDFIISSDEEDGRNPWGTLAKSWSNIDRARQPPFPPSLGADIFGGPPIPPPLPPLLNRFPPTIPLPPRSILNRIGMKNAPKTHSSHGSFAQTNSPTPPPLIHARLHGKRRHVKSNDSEDDSAFSDRDSSDADSWTRKSKKPRLRMYADEEEIKVQERIKLQARRRLSPRRDHTRHTFSYVEKGVDLRSRLDEDSASQYRSRKSHTRHPQRSGGTNHSSQRSRPTQRVSSVATSAWTRLAHENNVKLKEESEDESMSSSSDSEQSSFSTSEEEHVNVSRTTVPESTDEDEEEVVERRRAAAASKLGVDLRSKLNRKNSPCASKIATATVSSSVVKQRSPLRIEIDNDEYYRSNYDVKE